MEQLMTLCQKYKMAKIYVKRKLDPIEIGNERAKIIKADWLITANKKDIADLGSWAGVLGDIVSIEIEAPRMEIKDPRDNYQEEIEKNRERLLRMPIEERANLLEWFKIYYFMKSGFEIKEPPREVMIKAYKIQLQYFKFFPNMIRVPAIEFDDLLNVELGNKEVETLSEKMSMN